jgi:hypothetical protein
MSIRLVSRPLAQVIAPLVLAAAVGSSTLGCAGQLKVAYEQPSGDYVPINKTATFMAYTTTREWSDAAGKCVATVSAAPVSLPTGEEYFLGVETAALAQTSFTVETTEAGALSKLTLDSDPQLDETLQATAQLIESIATAASTVAPMAVSAGDFECPSVSVKLLPLACVLETSSDEERRRIGCPEK